MNIVIVNQPVNNRGDEAAHKSLMRSLSWQFPNDIIQVLFQGVLQDSVEQIKVNSLNITYSNFPQAIRVIRLLRRCALILNIVRLSTLLPGNYKISRIIKSGDLVICAPGGISMGLFQSWQHIYWLSVAKVFGKKIVYYSRSFGPFPEHSLSEKCFKKISIKLLNYFDFLSIRDLKTMGLADKLNLNYISSIDTAFLDTPDVKIPDNIKNYFDRPYIVFVPNSLTWHPAYTHIDQNYIDDYYLKIINSINIIYKDYPIIMLPQLYNTEKKNDKLYFDRLKEQVKYNIIVLDDTISSDVQQTIIAGSQFIIGSRYHTIVFAINNNKPVIALSYEHKITGLLDILNMNDSLVNFDKIIHQGLDIEVFGKIIEQKIKNLHINEQAKKKAAEIASDCMKQFVTRYK